jgi:hypothetical protein
MRQRKFGNDYYNINIVIMTMQFCIVCLFSLVSKDLVCCFSHSISNFN